MARKKGAALKKAERFEMAGKGLWYIFLAKAGAMAGQLIDALPLTIPRVLLFVLGGLGLLLMFLAGIAELCGLYVARDSHIGFRDAFWTELIGGVALVVIGYMMAVSRFPLSAAVVSVLSNLWVLRVVFCFSEAAKDLLTQKDDHTWAKRADYLRWGCGLEVALCLTSIGISLIPGLGKGLPRSALGVLISVCNVAVSGYSALFCFQASRSLRT